MLRKNFNMGGLNCQESEQTERLCEAFTGSRGLAPWRGLQGGNVPCLRGKLYFASQICIISGPFWSEFQKYYDFWWSQGAVLLFLKECVFWNHKCTILVPFLSKVKRRSIYNFGGRKGAVPPCLRKCCILLAKLHHFRPFLSKFTEIYNFWWLQGGIPSFHKRMCILESHKCTISVPFLSKFIHMI